jgi:hypothetical protein
MNIYAPITLCFILYLTVFIVFAISVPEIKIQYEIKSSLLGLLAVFPITIIEFFVLNLPIFTSHTFFSVMITALLFNGFIEETSKMLFMVLLPAKKVSLQVFFSLSLLCGLALGSFESVIYLFKHLQEIGTSGTASVFQLITVRMFTSVIIHSFCAGLSGLTVWSFRKKATEITPFVYAVVLHGLYNFFAGFTSSYRYFSIVVILFSAAECRIWYKRQKNASITI